MKAAWEWLKKYWEVLVGILLVVIGFCFGVSLRKKPVVIPEKTPEQKKAEDLSAKLVAEIRERAEKQKEELVHEHSDTLSAVVREQEEAAPDLIKSPDATNDYLKQVGDLVRGGNGGKQ